MKRTFLLGVLGWAAAAAYGQDDPDRRLTPAALYYEGLRLETEPPVHLEKAVAKYKKAVERAVEEAGRASGEEQKKGLRATAASALVRIGFSCEKMEPANIAEAQAAYGRVLADFADVEPWSGIARQKAALKGVEVHLQRLQTALRPWRDSAAMSPQDPLVAEKLNATWEKIQPLQAEAVPGLIWGLGHPDEVIRNFCAEKIVEVIDGPGVEKLLEKLGDPDPGLRAGVCGALQKIFHAYNEAADLDRSASAIRAAIDLPLDAGTEKSKASIEKIKPRAEDLQKKAAALRKGLPDRLDTEKIQGELARLLADEGLSAPVRLEAARALGWIGRIQGSLADALLKAVDSRNPSVRAACCRAAGSVDTTVAADKHRLADKLIAILSYDPARPGGEDNRPPAGEHPDWANDGVVRQAAAEALGRIGLIKSIPALIRALEDNELAVRSAAIGALREITHKDFEPSYEPDKPAKERQESRQKWEQWWSDTGGVVVLVERFWAFQARWKEFPVARLFDPALFLKEIESRLWAILDPAAAKAERDRAENVLKDFQSRRDVFVRDAVDLGIEALDRWLKYIGGETEKEGGKANAATRCFVAEVVARLLDKHGSADALGKVRDLVGGGDSASKKAGAATCLGFLPREKVGAAEREALAKALGAAEAEVREAAANALARVGEAAQAAELTKAAQDSEADVQIAALRALARIRADHPDTLKVLGEMIADEPDAPGASSKKVLTGPRAPLIRECAVDALGSIANPAAVPFLVRSRRDMMRNVREATRIAIQNCFKAKPRETADAAFEILRDEKRKTDDRIGAALCLGDTGDPGEAKRLVLRLTDENPPLKLRDPDPGVRMAICEALAVLKAKKRTVVERLVQALADEGEAETVRDKTFDALKATAGIELPQAAQFRATDPREKREPAVKWWQEWFESEKGKLSDET